MVYADIRIILILKEENNMKHILVKENIHEILTSSSQSSRLSIRAVAEFCIISKLKELKDPVKLARAIQDYDRGVK
jgi:hypothetical protein